VGSEPDPKYIKAWRRMRVLHRVRWAKPVGFVLLALAAVLPDVVEGHLWQAVIVAAGGGIALGVVADCVAEFLRCPRCLRRYWWGSGTNQPVLEFLGPASPPAECGHCGLPFGAERDPDGG